MKLDFLEKIYFLTLFTEISKDENSELFNFGVYENVGCFINKKDAVVLLKENGTELVNRNGCKFAMISSYIIGELFPKIDEIDIFKASGSKISVPILDSVINEVYYIEEDSYKFEFYELSKDMESKLMYSNLPFRVVK